MSLIICQECGKQFSDKAKVCPQCACPLETNHNYDYRFIIGLIGSLLLLIGVFLPFNNFSFFRINCFSIGTASGILIFLCGIISLIFVLMRSHIFLILPAILTFSQLYNYFHINNNIFENLLISFGIGFYVLMLGSILLIISPFSYNEYSFKQTLTSKKTLAIIVFGIGVSFLICHIFALKIFYIPSGSMENTLMPGDKILFDDSPFATTNIKHGDIIIFKYPSDPLKLYIKRVIGVSGDTIEIKNGDVYINDKKNEEKYIKEKIVDDVVMHKHLEFDDNGQQVMVQAQTKLTVPEGKLFVLGDNRNNSQDSRFWGFLPLGNIKGKAVAIYSPFIRIGFIK